MRNNLKKGENICYSQINYISSPKVYNVIFNKMKNIHVPKIVPASNDANELEKVFATIKEEVIDCCNWPEDFPYTPAVNVKVFHNGENLYIKFSVTENDIQANVAEDQGATWTDPCVEFFVSPHGNMDYYNFECTCTGKLLLAWHPAGEPKESAPMNVIDSVKRFPSLGTQCFALREGEHTWSVIEIIPAAALFRSSIEKWDGKKMTANFYKCGDLLPTPHFISWAPIEWKEPSFHRPEFFGEMIFE